MSDLEKQRPAVHCDLNGTKISSRYHDQEEIAVMMRALLALQPDIQRLIKTMWCNSKETWQFNIEVGHEGRIYRPEVLARQIEAAFIAGGGGHNGITITLPDYATIEREPIWLTDFVED